GVWEMNMKIVYRRNHCVNVAKLDNSPAIIQQMQRLTSQRTVKALTGVPRLAPRIELPPSHIPSRYSPMQYLAGWLSGIPSLRESGEGFVFCCRCLDYMAGPLFFANPYHGCPRTWNVVVWPLPIKELKAIRRARRAAEKAKREAAKARDYSI